MLSIVFSSQMHARLTLIQSELEHPPWSVARDSGRAMSGHREPAITPIASMLILVHALGILASGVAGCADQTGGRCGLNPPACMCIS